MDVEILHARSERRASRLVIAAELGRVSIRIAVWSAIAWCHSAIALFIESFSALRSSVADSRVQPRSDLRVSQSLT